MFEAAVGIEIINLNAGCGLEKRLMGGETQVDYLVAISDGSFYIGIYECGEVFSAVNLPDNVVAFAKLVEYGVEASETSANLFGHKSVLSGFLGCFRQSRILTGGIRAKAGIAFFRVIVKISKTYAITSNSTYSSIRKIAGKTSARLFG